MLERRKAERRRQRRKECAHKRPFEHFAAARAFRARRARWELTVYLCRWCGKYHLGRLPKRHNAG